ncbi:hypothetical protein N0V93_000002 [Gnomoniopsis smithogilvyi]|uniref:Uncharacterized protein n=1 Tax=Gnomoniopsis smithogilvyi TaxID=1191159 RepID=A0A9W8Z0Y4_9PEZI|nr:hypothetical protein N0V93_000002 [Gnomoniopsis smithogilvyi]
MTKSSISQTEDLRTLLEMLEQDIPAFLEPFASHETHGPSLKSLDSPYFGATSVAEGVGAAPKRRIIHTCEKIVAVLQGPTVKLTMDASGHLTSAVISIAVNLRLPHLISSDVDKPTMLDELVKATSASPDLLTRVLRYLTQRFIFEEPKPSCYVQNIMSKALAEPVTEAWTDLIATEYHRGSAALLDLLLDNKFDIPPESQPSALTKALGSEQSFYDYMRLENPDLGRKYALSMSAPSHGPHTLYPYAQLPAGSFVVDVGGGSGHITAPLARLYPKLKFVVQDSADTIVYGQSVYGSEGLPIDWQTVNFFKEQPVKSAKVYLLRHVLVDHPDRTSLQVLNCIANAMDEDSRLLIADAIVPDQYGEDSDSLLNVLDLHLLCMFNSKERSLGQWKELLESVEKDLEIVKVWRTDDSMGQEALMEIKLKG